MTSVVQVKDKGMPYPQIAVLICKCLNGLDFVHPFKRIERRYHAPSELIGGPKLRA